MYYRKTDDYDTFACIAGRCPDTCCAGWQILIDEESLERYGKVKGEFGIRLLNSIDWAEGAFEQYHGRCSFLNRENLCDLYQELGEEALCETCRNYPRHTEEYEGIREYSLSLSCPVAAEQILGNRGKYRIVETRDEQEETEDFEDFDFLLFGKLEEVRELLFQTVQDRGLAIEERMVLVLRLAQCMQESLDGQVLFETDFQEKLEAFRRETVGRGRRKNSDQPAQALRTSRYQQMCAMLEDFQKLEVLREEWSGLLSDTRNRLYDKGEAGYQEIREQFGAGLAGRREEWDRYGEQLLMFFLYTYFCGAVYDDRIYSKAVLSVFPVLWIQEILCGIWLEQGDFSFQDVVRTAYQCAREIEHSDDNLNLLEDLFEGKESYQQDKLSACILEERRLP